MFDLTTIQLRNLQAIVQSDFPEKNIQLSEVVEQIRDINRQSNILLGGLECRTVVETLDRMKSYRSMTCLGLGEDQTDETDV